eukprot:1371623-Prymnesium_polylepis.1
MRVGQDKVGVPVAAAHRASPQPDGLQAVWDALLRQGALPSFEDCTSRARVSRPGIFLDAEGFRCCLRWRLARSSSRRTCTSYGVSFPACGQ